jgi:hypothetical protein
MAPAETSTDRLLDAVRVAVAGDGLLGAPRSPAR